jgi:KAP family P-loop domain
MLNNLRLRWEWFVVEGPFVLRSITLSTNPARRQKPATPQDDSGSNALAHALSKFLLDRKAKAPISISVEQEWTSSKPSLLLVIEQYLREGSETRRARGIAHNLPMVMRFNALKRDNGEALWTALAKDLTNKIANEQRSGDRLKGCAGLLTSRFERRRTSADDSGSRESLVDELKKLRRLVEAYARDKTIFVFIDDLDQCSVFRAAEVMHAIELIISTELKSIVFIFSMDQKKIAAGLTIEHAKFLSHVQSRARCISIAS